MYHSWCHVHRNEGKTVVMGWGWVVQGWRDSPLWAQLGLVMLALAVVLQLADLVLRSWKGVAMAAMVMGVVWGCCGCERTAHAASVGAKRRAHAQRVWEREAVRGAVKPKTRKPR